MESRFENLKYPVKVVYCGECSLPTEFCSFFSNYDKCKAWLEKNLPQEFEKLEISEENKEGKSEDCKKSGRQKRGGKSILKTKKKSVEKHIGLYRANRGKKKFVTVVTGLGTFEVDLKEAAKFFASKFACGSSVTGEDEIVIQGDVKDDLFDIIIEKWPEIEEDMIEDMGERKL